MQMPPRVTICLLLAVLPTACDRAPTNSPADDPTAVVPVPRRPTTMQIDGEIAQGLASPRTAEALAWLDPAFDKTRRVWDTTDKDEARDLVRELYEAGAVTVWASDPTEVAGVQVLTQLAIELPPVPAKRAALFKWIDNWERRTQDADERTTDVGQRYYEVNLDR
jgi:hypothetical protein